MTEIVIYLSDDPVSQCLSSQNSASLLKYISYKGWKQSPNFSVLARYKHAASNNKPQKTLSGQVQKPQELLDLLRENVQTIRCFLVPTYLTRTPALRHTKFLPYDRWQFQQHEQNFSPLLRQLHTKHRKG